MKLLEILRKIPFFNKLENRYLTYDYTLKIQRTKEKNSKIVYSHYYVPLAVHRILTTEGYLKAQSDVQVQALATSIMLHDVATGVLTEFYKFKEKEN